ncbi:Cation-transporting P-type ATPase [Macleaya cordata]|uniref:Cation-transporting P-type ATPase n=1 Tax=Macleaya cordata TaxID=56857 RepID=A0A200QUP5_MACCD|nr:Cation-transporting P-type ATPase [Macleaya cordata]
MDSTISASTLFTLTKTLNSSSKPAISKLHRHFSNSPLSQTLQKRLCTGRIRCIRNGGFQRFNELISVSSSGKLIPSCYARGPTSSSRLACISSSAASFAYGGGDNGFGGGNGGSGGGGDGGSSEGEIKSKSIAGGSEEVSALSPEGMTCGGCAGKVKRILESQPQVASASVNLATETAIVWPVPEAKARQNWQQQIGETLAKHLTNCGFNSNLRDSARDNVFKVFEKKMDEKRTRLKESGREFAVSLALCAVCFLGHISHFFGANASWIHAFHSTRFHLSLSLFTLLGPGRRLIFDGLKSLMRGAPNMNTLVGLGALSSFAVSSIAAFIPKLGWKTFFEEPIMLISVVLLGRSLEQWAKLKSTSDMTGLLSILPSKARLLVNADAEDGGSVVEVSCNSLSVGDRIIVLPGDRIPADGIVRAGRSTVDESSLTGEPLPITKLPGAEVAGGSINLNGTLTVEVRRPGGETVMGDIIRLVEDAQSREAPVQRLADKVAGHFTYGVMALSAATFMFWNLFGTQIIPTTIYQGSPVSLAFQLSCSVLVVACPCALGLATPIAVLVGTSLGATKGLLLRGGNILEKFALVNTIVFDKTGTLTIGRPVVTKVLTRGYEEDSYSKQNSNHKRSEVEVLRLAAGVESNTIHPVGKAIVEAARAAGCQNVKVVDGTFREEPGSGAVATIDQKKVSVGTLEWVQRHGVHENPFIEVEEFKNQSFVYVGVDGVLAGLIYFEDKIREDASDVVASLSKQGINIYMLSGDKKHTAEYVASVVGIPKEKVLSGVKPDEKKKFISELRKDKNVVAMVGDGINDTAALASSDIGVAMGGGVGAASDVSSVVLMGNRLSQLLDALELSRLTMKTVKQNLWWAFAYNIVGIPIAAGLLLPVTGTMLTPSIAAALMGFSSLGVVTNSLLLRPKFASKQHSNYKLPLETKTNSMSDPLNDEDSKLEHSYTATK